MEQTLLILDRIIKICLMSFAVFSLFSISLTQISLAVGAVAWLTRAQLTHSWEQMRLPVGIPFLIFVLACIIAVITSVDFAHSLKPLKKVLLIITFFWVVNSVRETKQRDFLFNLLMGAACAAALYGFYQAITQGVSLSTRVEGTMSIYMTFAGLLMLIALMASARFLFAPTREGWVGAVVFLLILCLLLTLTRQAWLGFLVGLVFLVGLRKPILLFSLPVLLVLIILVAPGSLNERLRSMVNLKDATFQTRVALWRGGWEIFKDHPVTGCGFKCVDTIYPQYPDHAEVLKKYRGMHNNFLQLAVDTGLIGLTAWLSIWVVYFLSLYRRLNLLGRNHPDRWLCMGGAGVAVGFLVGGIFEVNFYDSEVIMLLYFLMALPFTVHEKGSGNADV